MLYIQLHLYIFFLCKAICNFYYVDVIKVYSYVFYRHIYADVLFCVFMFVLW